MLLGNCLSFIVLSSIFVHVKGGQSEVPRCSWTAWHVWFEVIQKVIFLNNISNILQHQPQLFFFLLFLFKLFMATFLLSVSFIFFFQTSLFLSWFHSSISHLTSDMSLMDTYTQRFWVRWWWLVPLPIPALQYSKTYWQMADCVTPNWMEFSSIIEIMYLFFFSPHCCWRPCISSDIARLPVWTLPWQHWFDLRGLGPLLKWRCMPCALLLTVRFRIKKCQKLLISPNVC